MPRSRIHPCQLALACLWLGLSAPVWSQSSRASAVQVESVKPPVAAVELELRGIMIDRQGPVFALYDSKTQAGCWVRLHQSYAGFTVTAFQVADDSIVIESSRLKTTLRLSTKKSPAPAVAISGTSAGEPRSSGVVEGKGPPLLLDEQQRLDELALEVKRIQAARLAGTLSE